MAIRPTAWEDIQLMFDFTFHPIIKEFSNEIFAEAWDESHTSNIRIKYKGMRMRISLSLLDSGFIVVRMIHTSILLQSSNHTFPTLRIIFTTDASSEISSFGGKWNSYNRRIPIIDGEKILLISIDGQLRCTCRRVGVEISVRYHRKCKRQRNKLRFKDLRSRCLYPPHRLSSSF
jgi:hypothetical protein